MRQKQACKLPFFVKPIPEIKIPQKRDAIYSLLRGIQFMYDQADEIIDLIMNDLTRNGEQSIERGPVGMTGWQVFILAVLRMNLSKTFAQLEFDFNHNNLIRQFLEINELDDESFSERCLNDNFILLSAETLSAINDIITNRAIQEGFEDGKVIRGDSFVCDTNVHFPTDQSLLSDGCRKVIAISCQMVGAEGWRQSEHWLKKLRYLVQNVSKSKKGKNKEQRERNAYYKLLRTAETIINKGVQTYESEVGSEEQRSYLLRFLFVLEQVRDVTERRTQKGETIEHDEKIFSLFETHTEMINRGKYPQPYQLGHRILFVQGKSGLILDFKVMDNGAQDVNELLPLLKKLFEKYGRLDVASFDKGYWAKNVIEDSEPYVEKLVVAKKGKGNKASKERESERNFVRYRVWRSGIEALISVCVRANGLDRCRDKGKDGYARWVSAAVVTRNLIGLGRLVEEREEKRQKRKRRA